MKFDLVFLKQNRPHFPVMITEVVANLKLDDDTTSQKTYLDCTFGAGGYSEAILSYPNTKIIALDRDKNVLPFMEKLRDKYPDRFLFYIAKFSDYPKILDSLKEKVDGIIMDLGISTMQIVEPYRGFSFRNDELLSMEMGLNDISAYELVNSGSNDLLADIIYYYGEESKAKQIAKKIISQRAISPITSTVQLADIVKAVYGGHRAKVHPATKTFQALRIYINDELKELQDGLSKAYDYLHREGRLLVVSFHSLEDRIVKDFLNQNGNKSLEFTNYKPNLSNNLYRFAVVTKKPIVPTALEIKINPPSSSAKLRVGVRV